MVLLRKGAAAVLEYNSIESPLAQPRNLVLGHFLSALLGVCITKLFALLPQARFDNLRWVAGGLAVGASSVVMGLTKTIHPPAGATALLAATSPDVTRLGWYLLPLVLLGCTLMLASACVINNIQRQFPMYWWTHVDLSDKKHRRANSDIERASQAEKEEEEEDAKSGRLYRVKTREEMHFDREHEIKITAKSIVIPDWLAVDDWERNVLDILRALVRESADEWVDPSQPSSRSSESTEVTIDGDEAEPPASRGEHSALSK